MSERGKIDKNAQAIFPAFGITIASRTALAEPAQVNLQIRPL
jgi:hypothetical protein